MDKRVFLEYLEIYGSELDKWPAGLRERSKEACTSQPELRRALEEERRFEEALDVRRIEEASPDLERRIIDAAGEAPGNDRNSVLELLGRVFSGFPLPRPAIALPLVLVLGMAAGYLYANYAEQETGSVQLAELLYYEEGYYE